jgi:hypothetical protein
VLAVGLPYATAALYSLTKKLLKLADLGKPEGRQ